MTAHELSQLKPGDKVRAVATGDELEVMATNVKRDGVPSGGKTKSVSLRRPPSSLLECVLGPANMHAFELEPPRHDCKVVKEVATR